MIPDIRLEFIIADSKATVERCRLVCKQSAELIERVREATHLLEDTRKRSEALRHAIELARGDKGYVLKRCSCGKDYHLADWFELPFAGYQESTQMGGEMRHCECQSTLLFITRREAA